MVDDLRMTEMKPLDDDAGTIWALAVVFTYSALLFFGGVLFSYLVL